jgi:hypothetical protein
MISCCVYLGKLTCKVQPASEAHCKQRYAVCIVLPDGTLLILTVCLYLQENNFTLMHTSRHVVSNLYTTITV